MDPETLLTEQFCCAKCRGRRAVARTVALGGLPTLLNLGADKYILLSCTLCGYTEIYNTHAFAAIEDEAEMESSSVPQQS
ncbi:MAG: zinc ribbon domain-containing protein [Candidatus Sumerlaeaceae bacterium]